MVNIALIFPPGSTREEVIAAVEEHFASPGATGTANRQSVVTSLGSPPPLAATMHTSMPVPGQLPPPVNAAPVPAPAVDVDTEGLPWDERIHAGTKNKNKDGTWTKRRGVDDKLVKKVTKELEALMSASGDAGAPPALDTSASTPIPAELMARIERGETVTLTPQQVEFLKAQQAHAAPPAGMPIPGQLPPPTLPPPLPVASTPPPLPSPQETAYAQFMERIVRNLRAPNNPAGMITEEWVSQVMAHYGVKDAQGNGALTLLDKRLDLVPAIAAYFDSVNIPA